MSHIEAQRRACPDQLQPCGLCQARSSGVCSAVPLAELGRLATLATEINIQRGQTFIYEEVPDEHCYIIIRGSVRLYKALPDGRRQIIAFRYAGSFLGLPASQAFGFSAECMEETRVCRLSRRRLEIVLADFRSLERCMLLAAAEDLALAQRQMLLLGRMTATERVASFLLDQLSRAQPRGVRWPRVHLPMSRSDVADHLGLTTETVSRALQSLTRFGIISVPNRHEIAILQVERLASHAHRTSPHGEGISEAATSRPPMSERTVPKTAPRARPPSLPGAPVASVGAMIA